MLPPGFKIIDISLELDPKNFAMRTPAGFKKDMQFAMEVIKEHDAPGGAGQIVRGVHMRLHAGSHVDAPEHNVCGGTQIHDLPLDLFIGDAVIADLRDKLPGKRSPKMTCKSAPAPPSAAIASCCAPISTTVTTAARKNG